MKNIQAKTIRDALSKFSAIEVEQKMNGQFVPDIPKSSTRVKDNQMELLNNYFFRDQDVYISKHNRFASYPLHSHQFSELNYMLSGSCRQVIDGQPIELHQGELLLIGTGISHELKPLGEGDLLINILFKKNAYTLEWLYQMRKSGSPLIQYLLNLHLNNDTAIYLLLNVNASQKVQSIMGKMLTEYYSADAYSTTLAGLYLPVLFTELTRHDESSAVPFSGKENLHANKNLLPILQLIEENYRNISLTEAADRLGYNKTYLGNLIKKTAGITFTQMITKRRLYQARLLLNTTNLPISDIARDSGFSNKTYFYHLFKETFGHLPSEDRKHRVNKNKILLKNVNPGSRRNSASF